jgi:hypothetical protein
MKHNVFATWPTKARKAWPYLSVLLLPALASEVGHPSMSAATDYDQLPGGSAESRPYLQYVGPPPLRFEEPAPSPDPTARLTAGAPPKPERPEIAAAKPAPAGPPQGSVAPVAMPAKSDSVAAQTAGSNEPPQPAAPSSILPDETRQRVKPEDFLPFFQFPGGSSAPVAPVPGALPPSSATYKQQ